MFDCLSVRLAKFLCEFHCVRLPDPIEVNRTIGIRLGSITERSIDYAGYGTIFLSPTKITILILKRMEQNLDLK